MVIPRRLWIVGAVVVAGVLVLNWERDEDAQGSTQGCEMEVTADVLNVREAPGTQHEVMDRLTEGTVVEVGDATENGFRQLADGRWVSAEYLSEAGGSDCG